MSLLKHDNSETTSAPPPPPHITPSVLIFFTAAVLVFCFVGFTFVFLCRCCFVNISTSGTLTRLSPIGSPYRGLDPELLLSFPTFLYATVKNLRKEKKYSLECAICLLEFDDDSMLRLLTTCYHVFHQECIDLWLRSHKTCPVCRTDLELPTTNDAEKPRELDSDNVEDEIREHVCIDVKESDGDHKRDDGEGVSTSVITQDQEQKFARSHSTGHSVVMVRGEGEGRDGDDDDKYTLRLPEHVALKIVRGGHNYSKSCSSYKDVARNPAPCSNCGYVQTVSDTSSRTTTKNN